MASTHATDIADQLRALSDFYVARTNWLIGRGRDDLIGESVAALDQLRARRTIAVPRARRLRPAMSPAL